MSEVESIGLECDGSQARKVILPAHMRAHAHTVLAHASERSASGSKNKDIIFQMQSPRFLIFTGVVLHMTSKLFTLLDSVFHPCAGAMLIFSASFQV